MLKKIIVLIITCIVTLYANAQYIKPNNSYGTIVNRSSPDSTQLLPTGCGLPSLRSVDIHKGAIYVDSCNHIVYWYDPKLFAWDTLNKGGGGSGGPFYDSVLMKSKYSARQDSIALAALANAAPKIQPVLTAGDSITAANQNIHFATGSNFVWSLPNNFDVRYINRVKLFANSGQAQELMGSTFIWLNGGDSVSVIGGTGIFSVVPPTVLYNSVKLTGLGAAVSDTNSYYLLGTNKSTGDVKPVYWPAGGGLTDLDTSRTSTQVTVLSSTGADAVIKGASAIKAGVLVSSDKVYLDSINAAVKAQQSNLIYIDSSNRVGTTYDSTSWNNLTSFTATAEYSVSSNKILAAIYSGSGTGQIKFKRSTMLDQQETGVGFKFTSINNTTDYGFIWGWFSSNSTSQSALSTYVYLDIHTGADFGKPILSVEFNGSMVNTVIGINALTSISVGDSIGYKITNNAGVFTFIATNHTTGQSVSVSTTRTYTVAGDNGINHNTSIIGGTVIQDVNSAITIYRMYVRSDAPKNSKAVVLGNSITNGSYAGSRDNIFGVASHFILSAGAGDVSQSGIDHLYELWHDLSPKYVFIDLGGNDIGFSVSSGTWQANLTKIHDTLVAHGIVVYWLLSTPRNTVDVTPLNTWITTNYPGAFIDTYSPLWSGSGTSMNGAYNSGDGVHPNPAGQTLLAATIQASPLYQALLGGSDYVKYKTDAVDGSDNDALASVRWAKGLILKPSGVTPGSYTNLNATIDIYGKITNATNGTSSGGSGTVKGAGTTNKLSKWVASDSLGNSLLSDNGTSVSIGSTPITPGKFTIAKDTNAPNSIVIESPNTGTSAESRVVVGTGVPGTSNYYITEFTAWGTNHTAYGDFIGDRAGFYSSHPNGLMFMSDGYPIYFAPGGNTIKATFSSSGKLGVGITAPTAFAHLTAATTGAASLRLQSSAGTDVSSPNSGDFWWNGTNLFFRTGSSTVDLLAVGSGIDSTSADRISRRAVHDSIGRPLTVANAGSTGVSLAYIKGIDTIAVGKLVGQNGGNSTEKLTDSSVLIRSPIREIGDYYDDFPNSSTTETDGYGYDINQSIQPYIDGDKFFFTIQGTFVGSATATRTVRAYFGGTQIFTSGGLTNASSNGWELRGWIIRVGSTTARCSVSFSEGGLSTSLGNSYTEVTGLNFSSPVSFLTTLQAGGTGAATNDIIEKMANFEWKRALTIHP